MSLVISTEDHCLFQFDRKLVISQRVSSKLGQLTSSLTFITHYGLVVIVVTLTAYSLVINLW